MIFIRTGHGAMTIQLEGPTQELFMEITSGAARVLLNALKEECRNDPDILMKEGRRLGELVGKVMIKQMSMGDDIQEIHITPDKKKGENLN